MRVPTVSFSADKLLARCEQRYSYKFDQRLKPKLKPEGLFRGAWIHDLLAPMRLKKPWKPVFKKLKAEEWDKLFEEEKEDYGLDFPDRIYELMEHYQEHYSDDWKVLHVEQKFSLDIKSLGIPIVWIVDLLVKDGKSTVLVETKAKKKIPESDERILAPQVHAYCFLLEKKGIHVDRIMWDYIRTTPVPRPQILKNGNLSTRKINTDQRNYLAAMKEAGIHPSGDEVIGVENYLKTLPETLSLSRVTNTPNLKVGEMFVRDWIERARRAREIKRPTRHYIKSCQWECEFYSLCQIDMIGKTDREIEINKNFIRLEDVR